MALPHIHFMQIQCPCSIFSIICGAEILRWSVIVDSRLCWTFMIQLSKIVEWLDAQAHAGRFGEVSDEEMLVQVGKHIPRYLS